MDRNRRTAGFSMIELLTVSAIILLIAAVATPTIMRSITTYRVGSATTDVYNMLQRTRYEAIRRNTTITCRAVQQNNRWVIWVDMDNNGAIGATEPQIIMASNVQLLAANQAPPANSMGFATTRTALPGAGVAFDFRGQINFGAAAPAVLDLFVGAPNQPSLGFRSISITPAGKMKIWVAPQGGPWHSQ